MSEPLLPLVADPYELEESIDADEIVLVDLSRAPVYARNHIPGAVHLDYSKIIANHPPVMGLLPSENNLSQVLSLIGISADNHVVAYDDEGGSKACRLLWTLDVAGHQGFSLLNGGLQAWINENHPVNNQAEDISPSDYSLTYSNSAVIADKDYILSHLDDASVTLVDARTPGEYEGTDKRAQRGGHIPGAINIEWARAIDQQRNLRLKSRSELLSLYAGKGITPDNEIITYCHTHARSAHSYIVLKYLGYAHVKGYPGSWSEWGNDPDTPVE